MIEQEIQVITSYIANSGFILLIKKKMPFFYFNLRTLCTYILEVATKLYAFSKYSVY